MANETTKTIGAVTGGAIGVHVGAPIGRRIYLNSFDKGGLSSEARRMIAEDDLVKAIHGLRGHSTGRIAGLTAGAALGIHYADKVSDVIRNRKREKEMQNNKYLQKIASTIAIKPSHKGLLHKKLGVPAGQPIPESKLEEAAHSSNVKERKEAIFAENAKKWNHK